MFGGDEATLGTCNAAAYDVQKIKRIGAGTDYDGETRQKLVIMGALTLYLDFINLFLFMLRLFGGRD
jgi:hypothetical protein